MVGQDFIEYFNHPSPAMQGFMTSVYGKFSIWHSSTDFSLTLNGFGVFFRSDYHAILW
jgi:hypothetical protein